MNRVAALITLMVILSSCSSTLRQGTYSSVPKGKVAFAGSDFTFQADSKFEYSSFTDESNNGSAFTKYGQGLYSASPEGVLTLIFEKVEANKPSIDVREYECTDDPPRATISAMDFDGKPIMALNVFSKDEKISGITQTNGDLTLTYPYRDSSISMRSEMIGLMQVSFELNGSKCHEIKLTTGSKVDLIPEDETWLFDYKVKGKKLLIKKKGKKNWMTYNAK